MMHRLLFGIVGVLALMLLVIPVSAQQATPSADIPDTTADSFTNQTDPVSLISAYYNAISRAEYSRAYSYWEAAPQGQTPEQFAAGFADTLSARAIVWLPVLEGVGAGNAYADLPTLVIALHFDGTEHYYEGCFRAHKTNVPVGNATEPDPNWYLQTGELQEYAQPDFGALASVCEEGVTLQEPLTTPSQYDPTQLIASYFIAAAAGNTAQAAVYWQNGSEDLFATNYGSLLTGAQNVQLFINPDIVSEGAAGSAYAVIPALTLITAADGSPYFITGCYTARRSNVPVGDATEPDPNWYLVNATFTRALDEKDAIRLLTVGCIEQG